MMAKNSSGYEDITEHGYSPSESTTQNCMHLPFILFGMIDKGVERQCAGAGEEQHSQRAQTTSGVKFEGILEGFFSPLLLQG
jgi:hypothetical protein